MKNGVMAADWRLGVHRAGRTLVPGWLDDVNRNVVVVVSDFAHAAAAAMSLGSQACYFWPARSNSSLLPSVTRAASIHSYYSNIVFDFVFPPERIRSGGGSGGRA